MHPMLFALAALSFNPVAAAAQPVQPVQPMVAPEGAAMLTLTVTESVSAAPDIAHVSAGVTTVAASAGDAMTANARSMQSVIATLMRRGIDRKDIQTGGFALNPQYRYPQQGEDPGTPPRITGYQVSNTVNVVVRDLTRIGATFDALSEAGATNISGPGFAIDDDAALLEKARSQALEKGRGLAEFYARAAGRRTARLVAISEGGGLHPPVPLMRAEKIAADTSTPVEPGQSRATVTVSLSYVLE